jgi:response regulator RpfG family c-di-GMP phosphodiesterase
MKLSQEMIDEIVVASLLHDIGRIGIKSDILSGKSEISEADIRTIRSHSENGAKILETIDFPWKIKPIIIHHHERYDGKGYPSGLKGREIPIGARILSVVDAFAAMTANRPYRRALSREEAVAELHKNVGTQFDPEVVEHFTKVAEQKYFFRGVGSKPRILLVDDEVDYLTLLKLKLVAEGFDVETSDNAEDALAHLELSKPDMVLSDIIMPGTDGIGMLRRMREKAEYADLPVVFLSGRDDNNVKIQALHLGAEDYLLKPVDFVLLAAKIRNVIRRDEKRKKGSAPGPSTGVVGDLKNLGIPEIVQTLHLGLKTACVTVNHPKGGEGRIYFENGRIRHCTVGGAEGENAFYRMLRWQEGPFVIAHGQTTSVRTIEMDEMQLMMEGMRRLDEEGKTQDVPS